MSPIPRRGPQPLHAPSRLDRRGPLGDAWRRLKWAGFGVLTRAFARLKLDVIPRDYYTPVPDLQRIPPEYWERPAETPGIQFEAAAHFEFLERELAPYIPEFTPRLDPSPDPDEFFLDNPVFGHVDAEVLYAMIRRYEPRRVIELGSGFSSLVISTACERNAQEGRAVEYRAYDPFPWLLPSDAAPPLSTIPVSAIPRAEFETLGESDILFVDTTHTVKVGSEVNHVVLQILPSLRPGVLVHFHDIFLPWHYPREWVEEEQRYWSEQYLLQAFLAFNPRFEVLFSSNLVSRTDPVRVARRIPGYRPGGYPGSFWLRRTRIGGGSDGLEGAPDSEGSG